jgi:sporulation protein YlmC with PRC-barrel domain
MRSSLLIGGLLATIVSYPVLAQSSPPARNDNPPAAAQSRQVVSGDVWRASKLKGLNVYNEQNEKLGDISEILIDKSGKVEGVVIGVGGFLGMGEHDIKVDMSKLKFVDEPARTAATTANTTGAAGQPATTTQRPAGTTATTTRVTESRKWYPDHAVLSGATKDQLKTMPQFKYN